MKQIILIFMAITFFGCSIFSKSANNSLIRFCIQDKNTIRVSYFDSTNGIVRINTFVKNDTLNLSFYVSYVREQKDFIIHINNSIRFLSYGDLTLKVDSISQCQKNNDNTKTQIINIVDQLE